MFLPSPTPMKRKLSRRNFVKAAVATAAGSGFSGSSIFGQTEPPIQLGSPSPRGSRRILYVSDPSSIARNYLPDPVSEDDLRNWVNRLASAKVDLFIQEAYTQGWTTYWRSKRFQYDARPQHRRFLPLLDQDIQPLEVLLNQSHRRRMTFLAGIRMNDNHGHVSTRQGVGAGADFLTNNPQWHLKDHPRGPYFGMSDRLDFSFVQVRDHLLSVTEELVDQFDVDGLELCFRDHQYFPVGKGVERGKLMTELLSRIRQMLEKKGRKRRKKLLLGARVFQTFQDCRSLGLEVPVWIRKGLIDYVSPADTMYCEPNASHEEFSRLCRPSKCLLYPGILPWSSIRMRRRLGGRPITLEQQRAVAMNMYAAGADGIFFYNHFVTLSWSPFYPHLLHDLAETRNPPDLFRGSRHYLFEPIWSGCLGFGPDGTTSTGRVNADRMVLKRGSRQSQGRYRFRVCEHISNSRGATLLFRAYHATPEDYLKVSINGTPILKWNLHRRSNESRSDLKAVVDPDSTTSSGLPPVPELPGSFSTFWFDLKEPPAKFGDNWLEVRLMGSDPGASKSIVIDEVEVFVNA